MKKSTKKRKNEKIKSKKRKNERKKVGKEGPKGVPTAEMDGPKKLIFHIRTVKRNRNEIEAQKISDFEHQTQTKKMKENERK